MPPDDANQDGQDTGDNSSEGATASQDGSSDADNSSEGSSGQGGDNGSQGASGDNSGWSPPSKDEWGKVQGQLKKARQDAAGYRDRLKAAEEGSEEATKEAVAQAVATETAALRDFALRTAIINALEAAKARNATVAARLVDTSKLELDLESGEITGLGDQIEAIRKEAPELFTRSRMPSPTAKGGARDDAEDNSDDAIARRMLKGGGS